MARIRTIKPEFWTDEKIVQLPFEARLAFIGMWNFCDDDGYLADEPERLRLQILPNDKVDIDLILDMLVASGLIERIFFEETDVLYIPRFADHQKISHKTSTKYPVATGKKRIIPASTRRAVALKYGCKPGGSAAAECYHCGAQGSMFWPSTLSGRPGAWVAFSGLELDHLVPEAAGGDESADNMVLSCRSCNRSRCHRSSISFVSAKLPLASREQGTTPDNSGKLSPEGNGKEGKGAASAAAARAADLSKLEFDCRELVGEEPVVLAQDFHVLAVLLEDGLVEDDIRTGIREAIERRSDPKQRFRKWASFAGWCRTAAQNRLAAAPRRRSGPSPPVDEGPRFHFNGTYSALHAVIRKLWRDRKWVPEWGPKPDEPGCRIPPEVMAEIMGERVDA